jgi:hypothetical protein
MSRTTRTIAIGALITWAVFVATSTDSRADDPVSSSVRYNREIVRIFERKCIACHTDKSLSMPLDSYHAVRPWAQAIREEILERRMPPWPAAPGVRPLANELALSTREIAIITAWIDGGTPRGEPSDLPAPRAQRVWKAGEPDLTLKLPQQSVTPDGTPHVRRLTIATGLTRDGWLRGFDVVPGEPRALRSALLHIKGPEGDQWLGGWTPWYAMTDAPAHVGFRLPAGASLEVELHYLAWDDGPATEIGKANRTLADVSTVGLYFHGERPASIAETITLAAGVPELKFRPTSAGAAAGAGARTSARGLRGETVLNGDTVIWAVKPRMDRAEKIEPGAIEMRAILPGGAVEPLLWIKDHRSDWQLPYVLREPARLPRGSRLVLTAHPENSAGASASASVLTYRPAAASLSTGRR